MTPSKSVGYDGTATVAPIAVYSVVRGLRTELTGFIGITWLTTSQSNNIRSAARFSFYCGCGQPLLQLPDVGRHVHRLDRAEVAKPVLAAPGYLDRPS